MHIKKFILDNLFYNLALKDIVLDRTKMSCFKRSFFILLIICSLIKSKILIINLLLLNLLMELIIRMRVRSSNTDKS